MGLALDLVKFFISCLLILRGKCEMRSGEAIRA